MGAEAEKYIKFYVSQYANEKVINLKRLLKRLRKNVDKRRIATEEDADVMIKDMSAEVLPK